MKRTRRGEGDTHTLLASRFVWDSVAFDIGLLLHQHRVIDANTPLTPWSGTRSSATCSNESVAIHFD